jgi:hypothetical protein
MSHHKQQQQQQQNNNKIIKVTYRKRSEIDNNSDEIMFKNKPTTNKTQTFSFTPDLSQDIDYNDNNNDNKKLNDAKDEVEQLEVEEVEEVEEEEDDEIYYEENIKVNY